MLTINIRLHLKETRSRVVRFKTSLITRPYTQNDSATNSIEIQAGAIKSWSHFNRLLDGRLCSMLSLYTAASIAYRKITLSRYDKWEEYTSNEWYQQLVGCKRLGIAWLHFQVTALFWHLGPKCIEKYPPNRRLSAIFSCGEGPQAQF